MPRQRQPRTLTGTTTPGRARWSPLTGAEVAMSKTDLDWQVHQGITEAKHVCAGCPVRARCLAHALAHREHHGIWGGLTPPERHRDTTNHTTCGTHDTEVARLTHEGHSAREIAHALGIHPRTVDRIRARLRHQQQAA